MNNNEEENLNVVKNMTKWQRTRFEMLISATGALSRAIHLFVFVAVAMFLLRDINGNRWHNWKTDERIAAIEQKLAISDEMVNTNLTTNSVPLYVQAKRYWKSEEHPPVDTTSSLYKQISFITNQETADKFVNMIWKNDPVSLFLLVFVGLFVLVLIITGPIEFCNWLQKNSEKC